MHKKILLARSGAIFLALSLLLSACATTPGGDRIGYDFKSDGPGASTFQSWFQGDAASEARPDKLGEHASVEQIFARAEVAYFDGDFERAAGLYMRMLKLKPAHPLNRFGAARLYSLRNELVDYHARLRPLLADIQLGTVPALTRVQLARIGQTIHWHDWNTSADEAPFSADALGFPTRWTTTPLLSPWRLTDFDRAFSPEEQPSIQAEYLSPYVAEDAPINYEKSRPYMAGGINLSPDFDRTGIYYLETFAEVSPDAAEQDYLLFTSFTGAARMWIDGELVAERDESSYETSERYRRIRLSPGEHRILIKLAYQKNYRDSFDLAFLADESTALEGSGLKFSATPKTGEQASATGEVELLGPQKRPAELEATLVAPDKVKQADDIALYLTLNAGLMDLEPRYFDAAFAELMSRHEDFATGYMLRARQVQTLWEVPSRMRDARALADIRRAHKLAPKSLSNRIRLGRWLQNQGKSDDEVQELLRANRDEAFNENGELRNVGALRQWATFVDTQGWSESAEKAWKAVLAVAPNDCSAAGSLQQLYDARSFYPELKDITPEYAQCPGLAERRALARPDREDERLGVFRKTATRYPYNSSAQIRYANELIAQNQADKAHQVLSTASERMPWSVELKYEISKHTLAEKGLDQARQEILDAIAENKDTGWLHWRLAILENRVPLKALMHDGKKAAMADVARTAALTSGEAARGVEARTSGDEAYYVLDFGARKYFPDGSAITLTHNLVRVMTKGAIDRFGEFSTPSGAQMVQIRTIKQDGSVRVPEHTPGKSTLSMPGLAPGDFVEFAYVQYSSPSQLSHTRRNGIRFFFRMGDISSRHSEYLVLNATGEFQKANQAPKTEQIETPEGPALRFVKKDSPRPRKEPAQVGWEEFLPWVQLHHEGLAIDGFRANQRTVRERIQDSSKVSDALAAQITAWRKGLEPGSAEEVKQLFYRVSAWIADPSMDDFSTDISHALMNRDGNPLMLLKAAYDQANIPAEIYLAKTAFQAPTKYEVGEFAKYRAPLLKVTMPDGSHVWLDPDGPDAIFNAVGLAALGQPAVCVSCEDARVETVPAEGSRPATRTVAIDGKLTPDGTLNATMTLTYHGVRAAMLRSTLRRNADPSSRQKLVDLTISNLLPGASLESFEFSALQDPDQPMVITAKFSRDDFARASSPDTFQIQTQLFNEAIAGQYAELAGRETPMMIPYQRDFDYAMRIEMPAGAKLNLRSRTGEWAHQSVFGSYKRSVQIDQNTLRVASSIDMPVQRVSPVDYEKFRRWAMSVDRSALLFVEVSAPETAQLP